MKRILFFSALAFAVSGAIIGNAGRADVAPLSACATNGDADGDGVPDTEDSAVTDSCKASHSGFEDCTTGAGDGIPDCQ